MRDLKGNTRQLVANALADVKNCDAILSDAAMRGTKAKPTVRELNDVLQRLANARTFLRAALGDRDA